LFYNVLDVAGSAIAPNQPLEKRGRSQAIGAVNPGAADFTDRVQSLVVGLAPFIDQDAPAKIVRRWHDRDGIALDIDSQREIILADFWKAFTDGLCRQMYGNN
jgi:hypothetical protein